MNSTKNHSIATNWRKNSMIDAVADTSRMAWAWVVVLQILGVNGFMWTTHRWSQNDFSMVQCFQTYWGRSTNFVCIENILIPSCNERNLGLQDHPIWQTSSSQSCSSMAFRKSGSRKKRLWILLKFFLMYLFFPIMALMIFFLLWSLPTSVAMKSSLLNHVVWNWEKSNVFWMTPR